MPLSKIQTGLVSTNAIGATELNLADNFAFTGTVSGVSDLVFLTNINNTSVNATTFEWSMDYDDYNNFLIIVNRLQGSVTTSSGLEVEFKFNGSYGGGQSNPYFIEGQANAAGAGRNYNTNGDGEFFFGNTPTKFWTGSLRCINFRGLGLGIPMIIAELGGTTLGNDHGSFYMTTGLHTVNTQQITDLRINFSNGNVSVVNFDIYGIRRT